MSWCPDIGESISIGGHEGHVLDLEGNPCRAFLVEFEDGEQVWYEEDDQRLY